MKKQVCSLLINMTWLLFSGFISSGCGVIPVELSSSGQQYGFLVETPAVVDDEIAFTDTIIAVAEENQCEFEEPTTVKWETTSANQVTPTFNKHFLVFKNCAFRAVQPALLESLRKYLPEAIVELNHPIETEVLVEDDPLKARQDYLQQIFRDQACELSSNTAQPTNTNYIGVWIYNVFILVTNITKN